MISDWYYSSSHFFVNHGLVVDNISKAFQITDWNEELFWFRILRTVEQSYPKVINDYSTESKLTAHYHPSQGNYLLISFTGQLNAFLK